MSTKTRRPVVTPATITPAKPKRKAAAAQEASKQAVLDNFDLEVGHRTRDMRAHLDAALGAFLALVDAEVLKIPRAMRTMTLGELESCWAGNFADTSRALAEKRFESTHPDRDQAAVLAAAKRKREVQSPFESSTPRRSTKSARTKATTSKTPAGATPVVKRRVVRKVKATKVTLPHATGESTLPQDHVFNPLLPKTPAAKNKNPRGPKRHESFFSANGSPVDVGADTVSEADSDSDGDSASGRRNAVEDEDDDDDDELPDPAAMERRALAASQSAAAHRAAAEPKSTSSRAHKLKRAPSLVFRQSLAGGSSLPRADRDDDMRGTQHPDDDAAQAEIPLSDGRTIAFNPLHLTPGRIDDELAEGGLGDAEKKRVKARVQEEVVRALTERMERWKGM